MTEQDSKAYREQDVKFVEWSNTVDIAEPDVREITSQLRSRPEATRVLDVGGGIGSLGAVLTSELAHVKVDVVDPSPLARDNFLKADRLRLIFGDYLALNLSQRYDAIIFRTVLHHIIGEDESTSFRLQKAALSKAKESLESGGRIYVTENFYESLGSRDWSGAIIYFFTSLKFLAPFFRRLGANTAGEGVRFRSYSKWKSIFESEQLRIVSVHSNSWWGKNMPLWQRIPLLCTRRFQAVIELEVAN